MDNLLNKIISIINSNIDSNKKKIKELETIHIYDLYDNINKFINKYNSNKEIDFNLLELFINEINLPYNLTLNDYKSLIHLSNKLTNVNSFNNAYNEIINLLIECINNERKDLLVDIESINKRKETINNSIIDSKKALSIIESILNKEIINNEDYKYITNYIKNDYLSLSEEEIKQFIIILTKNNASLMESSLKNAKVKKLNDTTFVVEEAESKPVVPTINNMIVNLLSYGQMRIYYKALALIKDSGSLKGEAEFAINNLIKPNTDINDRLDIYNKYSNRNNIKDLIIRDIKLNIIKPINDNIVNNTVDDNLFDILEQLLNKIESLDNEIEFNYINYLEELGLNDNIELLNKVDILLNNCNKACNKNKVIEGTLKVYMDNLEKYVSTYVDTLKQYKDNPTMENKETLELDFEIVKEEYDNLLTLYTDIYIKNIESKSIEQLYYENGSKFYKGCSNIKNIILFIGNDGEIKPIIEDDIDNNKRYTDKNQAYRAIIEKIKFLIDYNFALDKGHYVKSDNYEEEFLKEFRIKSLHIGESRLFYSRFDTNLKELFSKLDLVESPNVLLIYEVAFGNIDGEQKSDIYELALKRCKKNADNIRRIRDLLKADLSSLDESTKEQTLKEINTYLNKQCAKLGHLVSHIPEYKVDSMDGGMTL